MSKKKSNHVNHRKVLWAIILVGVLAYAFGEPYLEKWFGIELTSIRDGGDTVAIVETSDQDDGGSTAVLEKPNQETQTRNLDSRANQKPFLVPTGKKNRLRSPAGLIYGESKGEHRVEHVMRHAEDDKSRPIHSVFDGSKEEILKLIDEAYQQIKSKSNRVTTKPDKRLHFRVEHTVDMKRKIGYLGGKKGRRENFPPRSKLTLIIDNGKFLITAYPDR